MIRLLKMPNYKLLINKYKPYKMKFNRKTNLLLLHHWNQLVRVNKMHSLLLSFRKKMLKSVLLTIKLT